MADYTVHLETVISISVRVAADDEDAAMDAAYEEMPGGICAQCSGWGQAWSREEGEYEPESVVDGSGKVVWTRDTGGVS